MSKTPPAPVTPDGRYFVVRGRLWRCSNPALAEDERERLVHELMAARAAKGSAMRAGDAHAREAARARVDAAKVALGERGPVWWSETQGEPDGERDWNRVIGTQLAVCGMVCVVIELTGGKRSAAW